MKWQPIETAPYDESVDVWGVWGSEGECSWPEGVSVGRLLTRCVKRHGLGWLGIEGMTPVAWAETQTDCPVELIAKATGWPIRKGVDAEPS